MKKKPGQSEWYKQQAKEELLGTTSISNFTQSCPLPLTANYKSVLHYENTATGKLNYLLHISLNGLIDDSDDRFKVSSDFASHELNNGKETTLC